MMKLGSHWHGWMLAGFVLMAATPVHAQSSGPLSAEGVLQQMEAAYSAAKSYADTIAVRFRNPDGSEGARVECKLWYTRPKLIRIDATSRRSPEAEPKREVMWFDGESARMWSSTSPVVTRGKIQLAGSKMFGTYAYHIPTLLEPSYAGPRRLHQLGAPRLEADESIEGVDCYHLRGEWQGDSYQLWIGKADHLVRKIVADYSGYVMEELHLGIALNQPIDPAVFRFAPEEEAGAPLKKATPPPRLPGERPRP